jgi:mycoredoxin
MVHLQSRRVTEGNNMIEFYGAAWCGDCRRSKRQLDELGVEYTYIDTETTDGAIDKVIAYNAGMKSIPVIVFADGTHLTEPSNPALAAKLTELALI